MAGSRRRRRRSRGSRRRGRVGVGARDAGPTASRCRRGWPPAAGAEGRRARRRGGDPTPTSRSRPRAAPPRPEPIASASVRRTRSASTPTIQVAAPCGSRSTSSTRCPRWMAADGQADRRPSSCRRRPSGSPPPTTFPTRCMLARRPGRPDQPAATVSPWLTPRTLAWDLLSEAPALAPEVVELRRSIHRRPELGLDNPETQGRILEASAAGSGRQHRIGALVGGGDPRGVAARSDDPPPGRHRRPADDRGHRLGRPQRDRASGPRLRPRRARGDAGRCGQAPGPSTGRARRHGPLHVPARGGGLGGSREHARPGTAHRRAGRAGLGRVRHPHHAEHPRRTGGLPTRAR